MAMKLRIWAEDEPLSTDMETKIYTDVELLFDCTPAQMQQMVLELAARAHEHYANRASGEHVPPKTGSSS